MLSSLKDHFYRNFFSKASEHDMNNGRKRKFDSGFSSDLSTSKVSRFEFQQRPVDTENHGSQRQKPSKLADWRSWIYLHYSKSKNHNGCDSLSESFQESRYNNSSMASGGKENLPYNNSSLIRPPLRSESHDMELNDKKHEASSAFTRDDRFSIKRFRANALTQKPNKLTPMETIRLKEKEEYRMLLQQFTTTNLYQSPDSRTTGRDLIRSTSERRPSIIQKKVLDSYETEQLDQRLRTYYRPYFRRTNSHPKSPLQSSRTFIDLTVHTGTEKNDSVASASSEGEHKESQNNIYGKDFLKQLKESLATFGEDRVKRNKQIEQTKKEISALNANKDSDFLSRQEKLLSQGVHYLTLSDAEAVDGDELPTEVLPELTPEMEAEIEDGLRPTPPNEVLCEGFRLQITRRDMETLAGLNWLNDEVINFYMNLLMERGKLDNYPSVYAFNTFFYPKLVTSGHAALRRWTRHVDIFGYNFILVPVHLGMHWCLAVIDFKSKKIQYYDSMGGQNPECLNALKRYLQEESMDKKKRELDLSDWIVETVKNIPQQMNGSDCGMFTCKYSEYITRGAKITFNQTHMPYFRKLMVYEILNKRLL